MKVKRLSMVTSRYLTSFFFVTISNLMDWVPIVASSAYCAETVLSVFGTSEVQMENTCEVNIASCSTPASTCLSVARVAVA